VVVFRIVRSDNVEDPVLLNSLRSNYELGEEPRKVERSSTVIHMGLSAYLDEGVAHGTAQRWEKLGRYVAELRLRPGQGFNFAHTGHPLHLTLWGDPVKLQAAVADIQPVWD
jgi:hypothetical protein